MQELTQKAWSLSPPFGLIDETVVRNLFPEKSPGARKALVHRATRAGEILTLKPGLYCLAKPYRTTDPHPFVIAARLYPPSFISMESALAYHGLIPEAVHQMTSVSARRSTRFETPLGGFSFQPVPGTPFKAGVRTERLADGGWASVAGPWRAIADVVYFRKGVHADRDGLAFLTESLRIDANDLVRCKSRDFATVCRAIHNRRVVRYLKRVRQEIRK